MDYRTLMQILWLFHKMTSRTHIIYADQDDEKNWPFYLFIEFKEYYGMPRGTRSVFRGAFRTKRELHCVFLDKKAISITSKHKTTIFFSHNWIFFQERLKKSPGKYWASTVKFRK